jgi:hypothetical protein
VYADAFNKFVDEINSLAAYQWWEGSVYSILSLFAYPFAWSWQQWCRKRKFQQLREFVRSEYDHACLRSCRSRALYEGLKVAATPDLMVAYVDFFLGGDEKRPDLPPRLQQRFPMCIIFGGAGSYMTPYTLHSDNLLTSLMGQVVPPTIWYRFVAGLNAQLRTVRQGRLHSTLMLVINWFETHAKVWLSLHGLQIDLAWFQLTSSGYYQLGLVVNSVDEDGIGCGTNAQASTMETGGFSAGFYNTVGSKEGWSPRTFMSSRKKRAEVKGQTVYSFLDDDEKAEFEAQVLEFMCMSGRMIIGRFKKNFK